MEKKDVRDLLSIYLVLFLTLVTFGNLFVFIINWEDWFFGIKLDGWPAGLYLFSKALAAALLAYLLVKRENKRIILCVVSLFYLAFVFILPVFSSQRNIRNELGWTIFWIELALLIFIPVILFTVYLMVNRMDKKEEGI